MFIKFHQMFSKFCDSVTLTVSMGMTQSSGENVYAILTTLIERENIKQINLLLTGNLQYHWLKLKHNFNDEAARIESIEMDRKFIEENKYALDSIKQKAELKNITFNILFWEDYKKTQEYHFYYSEVLNFYGQPSTKNWNRFKQEIDDLSVKHPSFKTYIEQGLKAEEIKPCLRDYILDQCAMLAYRMDIAEASHEVYMGRRNSAMNRVAKHYKDSFVQKHNKLLTFIEVSTLEHDPSLSSKVPLYESVPYAASSSFQPNDDHTPEFFQVCQLLYRLLPNEKIDILLFLGTMLKENTCPSNLGNGNTFALFAKKPDPENSAATDTLSLQYSPLAPTKS